MTDTSQRSLFLNLPVSQLDRAVGFFTALGFSFNPKFTDENATCMLVGRDAYVMLLVRPYFATFTNRDVAPADASTEAIVAYSVDSREAVDQQYDTAIANGATPIKDAVDHGFMYTRTFRDPDGHHWEVFWMDPAALAD